MMLKKLNIMLGVTILAMAIGLYYAVDKNGQLKKENEIIAETLEENKKAVINLGQIITDLNIDYSKVSNNEFKKFNKSDINKIPMDKLIRSYNIGIKRVFKDYKKRTIAFTLGST